MRRILFLLVLLMAWPAHAQQFTRQMLYQQNSQGIVAAPGSTVPPFIYGSVNPNTINGLFTNIIRSMGLLSDTNTWTGTNTFTGTTTFPSGTVSFGPGTIPGSSLAPGAAVTNLGYVPMNPANNGSDFASAPVTILNLSAIPHISNLAALKAYHVATGAAVTRDGYAAANDAGAPVTYFWGSSACPLNAGAGDNGWQVQPNSGGGCWTAALPTSGADIRIWGATTGAGADAAVLAAVNAASQGQAGGKVLIPASYFKVAQSANLDLRPYPHVTILCAAGTGIGVQPTGQSNLTAPCTLQVNPTYTILTGANEQLSGLRIVNQNVEIATTVRTGITQVGNFAGTGLTITQNDTLLEHIQVNGFTQGIKTISPFNYAGSGATQMYHVRMFDVQGDDTGFITMGDCGDACMIDHADAWNFITTAAGSSYYIIANLQDGGVGYSHNIEITTGTQGTPLISGDVIEVYGISGTSQPSGRFTVGTIIDATHFTLAGTTFSGGYTSPPTGLTGTTNGTTTIAMANTTGVVPGQYVQAADITASSQTTVVSVVVNTSITVSKAPTGSNSNEALTFGNGAIGMPTGRRTGIAYEFTGTNIGGQFGYSLWEYGHDTAVHMGPGHGPINIYGLWFDGPGFLTDPIPVGIWNEGYGGNIFGGALLNKNKTILNNAPDLFAWYRPLTINGSQIQASGCQAQNGDGSAVTNLAGSVVISSSFVNPSCPSSTYPGYNEFSVTAGASMRIATTNLNGATFGYPAAPAWQASTNYTNSPTQSYVSSGGNTYRAAANGTSGTTGLGGAGTTSGTLYNDNGGSGGLNWYYVAPTCLSVTIDGDNFCTPPAATTSCSVGQTTYDGTSVYFCTAANTWQKSLLSDFSNNVLVGGTLGVTGAATLAGVSETSRTLTWLAESTTTPTISSGFCTGASVQFSNGTIAFQVGVGSSACTGIQTGVIGLPTAHHGWACNVRDVSAPGTYNPVQTGYTTTSATFKNYSRTSGALADWLATDALVIDCHGF